MTKVCTPKCFTPSVTSTWLDSLSSWQCKPDLPLSLNAICRVLQRYFAILLANLSIGEQQRDLVKRLEALESAGVARRKTTHEQEKVQAELEALRAKMADAEVMIKQAQQQQDEYMRLADRYNELEKKYEGRLDEKAKSK